MFNHYLSFGIVTFSMNAFDSSIWCNSECYYTDVKGLQWSMLTGLNSLSMDSDIQLLLH